MLPVATPSHPSSAPLPWHRDLDQALSWVSPCQRQEAPEQPHGLTSVHRKLHSNLSTTPWSTRAEHLQPLQQGKRMTATSVIPSRAEEAAPLALLFPIFTYAITVPSVIWICLRSCRCPAACSSQITFQRWHFHSQQRARLPSEGEQRDAVALHLFLQTSRVCCAGAAPRPCRDRPIQPGSGASGSCGITAAHLAVEFINSHLHSSISLPVHQG